MCAQFVIQNLDDAQELLDRAISTAIHKSKPVYLSISCNLPSLPHPSFKASPIPYTITQQCNSSHHPHRYANINF